jgi:hypothetical protein
MLALNPASILVSLVLASLTMATTSDNAVLDPDSLLYPDLCPTVDTGRMIPCIDYTKRRDKYPLGTEEEWEEMMANKPSREEYIAIMGPDAMWCATGLERFPPRVELERFPQQLPRAQ